jgi:hypothetical protein
VIAASRIKKDELKQQGYLAFQRKDYDAAILFYGMVTPIPPLIFACKSIIHGSIFYFSTKSQYIPNSDGSFFRKSFYEVAMGLLPHSSGSIKKLTWFISTSKKC